MRTDTATFLESNDSLFKEPRFYIEVMWDNAYTDPVYFTSHPDVALPSTATTANTYHGVLDNIQGTQQKLNPIKGTSTIGNGKAQVVDLAGTISNLLNTRWIADEALRGKRFRTYVGYKGDLNSDYALIGTQNKYNHTFDGASYLFSTEDLQRSVRKEIFDLNQTTLTKSVTIDQVAFAVTNCTNFETNWHDVNYSDSPSTDVGYLNIEVNNQIEVVKWTDKLATQSGSSASDVSFAASDQSINSVSAIDFTTLFLSGELLEVSGSSNNDGDYIINTVAATKMTLYALDGSSSAGIVDESAGATISVVAPVQFYGLTRGSLATAPQLYDVDTGASADRRQKVLEHVYIETALPKIIYGVLTGIWYGTANTLPSNWHLDIDTSLINSASITQYADLYDNSDESGKIFRFSGEKKQDGKKFIAEQCCLPVACFMRVLNDGTLGLRRMTPVLSAMGYVRHLTQADIVGSTIPELLYDDKDVHNIYRIYWNYEITKGETTRTYALTDANSVSKQNGTDTIEFTFRGLHGSRHTIQTIYDSFNMLRDRYAGPPLRVKAKVLHKHNNLEIGDVIRLSLDNVYDATNESTGELDRQFEVQGMQVDWLTGDVTLDLFGSTERAQVISPTDQNTVLSNDFYSTTTGLLATKKLDHASVPLTTSFTGGVLHITGVTGDLVGETSITTNSIYWYDNPVQIDTGVDVTFTNNIRLYVKGDLTINGSIQGIGAGVSGAAGVMGVTKSQGGVHADYQDVSDVSLRIRGQGTTLEGDYLSMPFFNIIVDSAGDSITGAPLDLRGTGGATGTSTYWQDTGYSGSITGGAVTQGGGGLLIVCRGISFGASGYIDTSGEDGVLGGSSSPTRTLWKPLTVYAGSSGGGAPGGVLILLDGNSATSGAGDGNFVQNLGDSPYVGDLVTSGNQGHYSTGDVVSGGSLGFAGQALNTSFWRVQYLPDTTAAEEDQSEIAATATAFSSTPETQNQPETTVQNLSTIQVNLTAPSDTNYDYSNVYYKESTQDAYQFVGRAKNSINLPPTVMDGSTYDIIAKPVSKLGVESPAYIHTTKTVSNTTGGATFVTGNYIAVGQTAYDTGNGAWIEKTASGVKASFGASAGDKVLIDNSAGSIVDITGKVTADSGSIGGWTISSTTLANSTNIILDATNKAISINSATYGNAGVQIQYNSGTPRIYAGNGSTKSFEFDGTDVILGKDIKGFGVSAYNNDSIYLAGMLQDAAIYTLTSGSATVTQNSSSISFFCPATASNYALFIYYPGYTLTSHSWDKNRRLKLRLKTQLNTNHDFEIGMGEVDQTTNNRQIGVRFDTDGNIYGRCADNTSATDTSLTTWSTATNYTLEIVLTAGSQVDFYLDGSAIGSPITTNIPTGTVYANYVTKAKLTFVSGAASSLAYVGEYKFQQDE